MLQDATRRERADAALLRRYRDRGDLRSRDELTERCIPLVKSIARKYQRRGEDFDDLVQAGMVGLVKAIDRFDLDSGHRFVSYAVPNIQGEIRRHFRDTTWAVHVPRSMQELDQKVQRATAEILAQTGREPTVDDLASALGVPATDVEEAVRAGRSYRTLSTDAPTGDGETEAYAGRGELDRGFADVDARATIERAMEPLDDRAREVLRLRYSEDLLQREIAPRVGVSQMQVSRILTASLQTMHHEATGSPDGETTEPSPHVVAAGVVAA